MTTIKLYGYATSPYVRKTACFLYYKGLEFTHVPVNPVDPMATLGHIKSAQVPVLEIDGVYKHESSSHAHWLDELFPEKPLCPIEHKAVIDQIDDWVSNKFLTSIFRSAIDGENSLQFKFRGWRLAALISAHTPLPEKFRHAWPDLLRQAPFIQSMSKHFDLTESYGDMQRRIAGELVEHIGDGPFLGGLQQPSMLDLAIFPQLIWGVMFGLEDQLSAAKHPVLKQWLQRMATHLPDNPTLVADEMQVMSLSDALK